MFNAFTTWKKNEPVNLLLRTKGKERRFEEEVSWTPTFPVPVTPWVSSEQVNRGQGRGTQPWRHRKDTAEVPSPALLRSASVA